MGQGRGIETELMPKLVVDYTELGGSKLKKGKGFLKPNFGFFRAGWRRNKLSR
jgi:hypothetical protein